MALAPEFRAAPLTDQIVASDVLQLVLGLRETNPKKHAFEVACHDEVENLRFSTTRINRSAYRFCIRMYYGPCVISKELREYLLSREMQHSRGRPHHPMTQGKIERYHRSLKNVVKLRNYYLPLKRQTLRGRKRYNLGMPVGEEEPILPALYREGCPLESEPLLSR